MYAILYQYDLGEGHEEICVGPFTNATEAEEFCEFLHNVPNTITAGLINLFDKDEIKKRICFR